MHFVLSLWDAGLVLDERYLEFMMDLKNSPHKNKTAFIQDQSSTKIHVYGVYRGFEDGCFG